MAARHARRRCRHRSCACARTEPPYKRKRNHVRSRLPAPTFVCGDTIVFVCDDDLWRVDAAGGIARRLTAGLGEPATPVLSPDGQWIAYVGRDEQHPEVYLMPAEGGPARRMTWLGPDVMVRGWTPEGRILFVTTHGQPFFRNYRAFTLPVDGRHAGAPAATGRSTTWPTGPARRTVIGRNTADPARWKRYRGGTAGHLWIDAEGRRDVPPHDRAAGQHHLPDVGRRPHLLPVRRRGRGQPLLLPARRHRISAGTPTTTTTTRATRRPTARASSTSAAPSSGCSTRPPTARGASTSDVPCASHAGGAPVRAGGRTPRRLQRAPRPATAWRSTRAASSSRSRCGKARCSQHGAADGVRYRHGQWLADGATLVGVSDASGEERVEVFEAGKARTLPWDIGRVLALRAAPQGQRIAIANHRNEVLIGDLDTGALTVVDRSDAGRSEDLAWSPDGAWLAYTFWTSLRHCAIKLHEVGDAAQRRWSRSPSSATTAPAFDPEGKYLYFLSLRTFDPVYDSVQFELSFPRAARPYLIALQAGGPPPFEPEPEGPQGGRCGDDERQEGGSGGPRPAAGDRPRRHRAARRRLSGGRRPLRPDRRRGGARSCGRCCRSPARTGAAATRKRPAGWRSSTSPRCEPRRCSRRPTASRSPPTAHAARAQRQAAARRRRRRASPTTRREPAQSATPSRKSGWIDLARVRLSVEPRQEWRQMLREVWRLQRDQFWVAGHVGRRLGRGLPRATSRCSPAWPRAANSPT